MEGGEETTFCQVCKLNCRTPEKYAVHITTDLHKKIAESRQNSGPPKAAPVQETIPHVVEKPRGSNRGGAGGGQASRGGNAPFGRGGMQRSAPPPLHQSFIMGSGRGRGDTGMGFSERGRGDTGMGFSERGRGDTGMGFSGRGRGDTGMGFSGRGRGDTGMGFSGRGRSDTGMGHSGRGRENFNTGTPGRGGRGGGTSGLSPRGGGTSGTKGAPVKKLTGQSGDTENRCDICQLVMSGPESYQQHLLGAKHQKMLADKGMPVEEKKVKQIRYQPGIVTIQAALDAIQSELVGLQYLVEWKHPTDKTRDPTYECFLCFARMDVRNVLSHLTGFKHKHTYLKIHYADRIRWLDPTGTIATGPKTPEWKPFLVKQIATIAAAEGRSPVAVYEWDGTGTKPDVYTGAAPIKRPASLNQNLPEAKRQALEGLGGPSTADTKPMPTTGSVAAAAKVGEASLTKLLGALKDYEIRSDSEASLIVQIKDALSSSLNKYHKKMGKDMDGAIESFYTQGGPIKQTTSVPAAPPPPPPPQPSWGHNMPGAWPHNGNNASMSNMYGYGYGDRTDFYGQPMWH